MLYLKKLPSDDLAKHFFACLREISHPCTKLCPGNLFVWCAKESTCWLKMADLIWSWGCFAALHLLGYFLAACPSPHGIATGCLPFSSWDGSWASSFQYHGFAGWCSGDCLRTVVFSSYLGLAEWVVLPLAVHFSLVAGSAGCCGAASSSLSQMTELLVSS
jgi:hypothetical protein